MVKHLADIVVQLHLPSDAVVDVQQPFADSLKHALKRRCRGLAAHEVGLARLGPFFLGLPHALAVLQVRLGQPQPLHRSGHVGLCLFAGGLPPSKGQQVVQRHVPQLVEERRGVRLCPHADSGLCVGERPKLHVPAGGVVDVLAGLL